MHLRRRKFQFRGRYFRNSLFRVPVPRQTYTSPPPYSTDQRRSFDPKILDRDYSRNELNFSERRFRFHFRSLPESNPEEEIGEGRNDETLA